MSSIAPPPAGGPPTSPRDSILHPQDQMRHLARGRLRPDMSVREGLELMGIDVDGPITQLGGAMRNQLQNATTEGKIRGAASAPPPTGGPPPPGPGGPPPPSPGGAPGGLGSLLGGR